MKKITAILVLLVTMSTVVFAGNIDVGILADDNAQLFIGTLESFTTVKNQHTQYESIESAVVTAVEKIKGDVEVGVTKTYSGCHFEAKAEKNTQHLFVYFNEHNFYLYEMTSWDNGKIKLKNSDKYGLTKSIEDWINDGTYALAEEERINRINQKKLEDTEKEMAENNSKKSWTTLFACAVAIGLPLFFLKASKKLNS